MIAAVRSPLFRLRSFVIVLLGGGAPTKVDIAVVGPAPVADVLMLTDVYERLITDYFARFAGQAG